MEAEIEATITEPAPVEATIELATQSVQAERLPDLLLIYQLAKA